MVNAFVIPLAFLGLIISLYIYSSKKKSAEMVCVLGGSCNQVTGSKYSRTLGIPNEIGGVMYFSIIIILTILSIIGLDIIYFSTSSIMITLTALASLFAVYLLFLQAFVLKKWCEYCIITSTITFLILLLELI